MKLNLGPGEHYADGWVNLDATDRVRADRIVDPADPFGTFDPESAAQVYLGHVLEHVWWHDIPRLLGQVYDVLAPGGAVLVTGPDMVRLLERWKTGAEPWWLVESAWENADNGDPSWPEAVHKWNCHEARVIGALTAAGFVDVAGTEEFAGWPVVNWSAWQCAVRAVRP